MSIFSERLKMLRKEKGMRQGDLATKLNYGYTAIANYESGRNEPSLKDLIRLADEFNVTIDYLIGYKKFKWSKPKKMEKVKFGHYSLVNQKAKLVVRFVIKVDN